MDREPDKLNDPARLRALRATNLLDSSPEPVFDRITRLASRLHGTPLALVTVLDDRLQFAKSCVVPAAWPAARETPVQDSFCRYVVSSGDVVRIDDARDDTRISARPAVTELGLRSYLGVPLRSNDGHVLGTLCVGDLVPRHWTDPEVQDLEDLAASVSTEIQLRQEVKTQERLADDLRRTREIEQEAQRALAQSEERFRALTEHSSDVVTLLDAQAVIRFHSASAERVLGYGRDELVGRRVLDLIHPDDRQPALAALHLLVSEPGAVHRVEFRFPHKNGGWRLLEARGSNRLEDPAVQGLIVTARDVTEQREAEHALRDSEERFRQLAENVTSVFWMTDIQKGRMIYISPAYETVWGRSMESLYVDPGSWIEAIHPEDRERVIEAFPRQAIAPYEEEYRITRADGGIRWIHNSTFPVRGADGEVYRVAGLAEDITARKRIEEELRAARDAAEAASRAKSELLSRMSHELRTPLNAILGFAQLLELDVQGEDERESVEQILRGGRHLLALIDEVLDIARIEAGRMSLSIEPVSVVEILRESVDLVRPMAVQKEVGIRGPQVIDPCRLVWADQHRLKQVLLNLLSNAIKYNRPGGSIALSCEETTDDMLRIAVADTGHGISAGAMRRIFTPFDRLGADQRGESGSGLGLVLTKGLVEAMGGRIGVESVEGEGSTFWVQLPRPQTEEAASGRSPQAREGRDTPTGPVSTVLLVEDNVANANLIARVLQRRARVRLITAMQGRLGLELAREHRPDLVLLDVNLPDVSGTEILRELKEDPALREIPVLVMSGGIVHAEMEELLAMGARSFLMKPFDLDELVRVVDDALRRAG